MRIARKWIIAGLALSLIAILSAGRSQATENFGQALIFYCAPDFDSGVLLVTAMVESGDGATIAAMAGGVGTSCAKTGDEVRLTGFGTFSVARRDARRGTNPQTGAPIQIAASKIPSFKAGKGLKDAVNRSSAMLVCGGTPGQQLVEIVDRGDDATLQAVVANVTRCVDAIVEAAKDALLMHATLVFQHEDCSAGPDACVLMNKTLVILRNAEEF